MCAIAHVELYIAQDERKSMWSLLARGWTNLWLECGSLLIVHDFTNLNLVPWKLKVK